MIDLFLFSFLTRDIEFSHICSENLTSGDVAKIKSIEFNRKMLFLGELEEVFNRISSILIVF